MICRNFSDYVSRRRDELVLTFCPCFSDVVERDYNLPLVSLIFLILSRLTWQENMYWEEAGCDVGFSLMRFVVKYKSEPILEEDGGGSFKVITSWSLAFSRGPLMLTLFPGQAPVSM